MVRCSWLPALAAALFATCDIPTEAPIWTTDWILPVGSTVIGVSSLLPSGVALAPDSAAFIVQIPGTEAVERLGEFCEVCVGAAGQVAPKPAFVMTFSALMPLPADLVSVTATTGSVVPVQVANGFNFDPIRPGGATGSITVETRSQGEVLGRKLVSGDSTELGPGNTFGIDLPLAGVIREEAEVEFVLDSPLGDPIELDPNLQLDMVVSDAVLYALEAQVRVSEHLISSTPATTSIGDIPVGVVERLVSGRLEVDVNNPFGIHGPIQVRINYADGVILHDTDLTAGESILKIVFSVDEFRRLVSSDNITVEFRGVVSAGSGVVTLRPDQKIELVPRLYATLRMES